MKDFIDKKILLRLLATIITVLLFSGVIMTSVSVYSFGYELYVNGEKIGVLTNKEEAVSVISNVEKEDKMHFSGGVETVFGIFRKEDITSFSEACDTLRMKDERYKEAFSLYVGGDRIYSTDSYDEALGVKIGYLSEFSEENAVGVNFSEASLIKQEYVPGELIADRETMEQLVTAAGDVETEIKIGTHEEIPFGTKVLEDVRLYEGESRVLHEGEEGKRYIEHRTLKVNGTEKSVKCSEVIVKEPEIRVVAEGIKPCPKGFAIGSFTKPTEGYISSPFGARWGRMHKGVDIAAFSGEPIYAADGGEVVYSGWMEGYGNYIEIDHKNGYTTRYGHCSALFVSAGDKVSRGEHIADVGSTGRSTGPHLHFEIRLDDVPQNPESYVEY